MTIFDLYQFISSKITNKVGKIIKSEHGAVEKAIVDVLDDVKYNKSGGVISGKVTIRKSRDGNYFEVVDNDSNATLAEITQDGQINLYGRAGIANGAINLYTSDKKKRYIINTLNGNIFIELYNANEDLKAVIDSAGMSKLLGIDVQNEKIINVADPIDDTDSTNKRYVDTKIGVSAGMSSGNIFLSNSPSEIIEGYKTLEYSVDQNETEFFGTVNDSSISISKFIYHLPIDLNVIATGIINFDFWTKVSDISGESTLIIKGFYYSDMQESETLMFEAVSQKISSTEYVNLKFDYTITTPITDIPFDAIFGVEVLASTTQQSNTTIYFKIGDGTASNLKLPIAARHDQTRGRDLSNQHPIDAITGLKEILTGGSVNQVLTSKGDSSVPEWKKASGGASQDSIEFPVPTVYTYTGDYITKVVETIEGGTIEKRLRYYISASPIVDGSPDIMEYKNSVTGFWKRSTYVYTAGKLTSITTATIIAWSI